MLLKIKRLSTFNAQSTADKKSKLAFELVNSLVAVNFGKQMCRRKNNKPPNASDVLRGLCFSNKNSEN
jgi:hypothetical protein